jgi:hypothetical protein
MPKGSGVHRRALWQARPTAIPVSPRADFCRQVGGLLRIAARYGLHRQPILPIIAALHQARDSFDDSR